MKKALLISVGAIAVLVLAFFALNAYIYNEKQGDGLPKDFKEVLFVISGEPVSLVDGSATVPTTLGDASPSTLHYFGNELAHDIDGDGVDDMVFLVTQEPGGSGTFFYLVGALKRESGYLGTHAVLIGDRIAPQRTEKGEGRQVLVQYAERAPGDPMTARPSVAKTLHLLLDVDTLEFGEMVQGFEGESR